MTMTDSFKLSLNSHPSAPPPCDTADPHPSALYTKAWPSHRWQPIDLWPNPSLPSTSSTVLAHCLQRQGGGATVDTPPHLPHVHLYIHAHAPPPHVCNNMSLISLLIGLNQDPHRLVDSNSLFRVLLFCLFVCFLINILQRNNDWNTNWIHSTSNATLGTLCELRWPSSYLSQPE